MKLEEVMLHRFGDNLRRFREEAMLEERNLKNGVRTVPTTPFPDVARETLEVFNYTDLVLTEDQETFVARYATDVLELEPWPDRWAELRMALESLRDRCRNN